MRTLTLTLTLVVSDVDVSTVYFDVSKLNTWQNTAGRSGKRKPEWGKTKKRGLPPPRPS